MKPSKQSEDSHEGSCSSICSIPTLNLLQSTTLHQLAYWLNEEANFKGGLDLRALERAFNLHAGFNEK